MQITPCSLLTSRAAFKATQDGTCVVKYLWVAGALAFPTDGPSAYPASMEVEQNNQYGGWRKKTFCVIYIFIST